MECVEHIAQITYGMNITNLKQLENPSPKKHTTYLNSYLQIYKDPSGAEFHLYLLRNCDQREWTDHNVIGQCAADLFNLRTRIFRRNRDSDPIAEANTFLPSRLDGDTKDVLILHIPNHFRILEPSK